MKILVIGDVIEDVIVIPKGQIRPNTDTLATIRKTMGGSAANVASWLAHLGSSVSFHAAVNYLDSEKIRLDLSGIDCQLQESKKPTGSLVALIDGQGRSMLTDRGANEDLDLGKIDPRGFGIVYLSGYALLGKKTSEVESFLKASKEAGALIAIDPGSYGFIQDFGVSEYRDLLLGADIAFPNSEEEQLLELAGKLPLSVITKGAEGVSAVTKDGLEISSPALSAELVDPTGAGDAFCAGFLASLATLDLANWLETDSIKKALESGQRAGAKAIAGYGARPNSSTV